MTMLSKRTVNRISAHQPNYLPHLAFFSKMKQVDQFIVISNLQFEKHEGWQQRHRVPGPAHDLWLTVPVYGGMNQLIRDVKIKNDLPWRRKHKKTLQQLYSKTAEQTFFQSLLALYDREWTRLVDLNFAIISLLTKTLGISTTLTLDEEVSGKKHQLIANICHTYGAAEYLSGAGARTYITPKYDQELKNQGVHNSFVTVRPAHALPYAAAHYLLTEGIERVLPLL